MNESPKPVAVWKPVVGWLLVAIAIVGSIVAGMASGSPQVAGYAMGRAYVLTIVIIVVSIFVKRREDPGFKANITLVTGALILGIHAWFGYQAFQAGSVDREFNLAMAESDRIGTAAMQEIAAISAGNVDTPPSANWRPYLEPKTRIELDDASVSLHLRIVELTRRERVRQVEFARESARASLDSDFDIVVDPLRLLDAQERQAALGGMQAYRDYLGGFEERLAASSQRYYADLRELGIPQRSEQDMKAGYDRKVSETVQATRDVIRLELLTLDHAEKIVRLVDAHSASVGLAGGRLAFGDSGAQSEYEELRVQLGLSRSDL